MPRRRVPPPVGSHLRTARGLVLGALPYADQVGAQAAQVFVGNPRGWSTSTGDPAEDAAFRAGCEQRGLRVFVHSPYLVNLASPTPETAERSAHLVAHTLLRAAQVGAEGVVVHTGSTVISTGADGVAAALAQVRDLLLPVLERLPDDGPSVLLEPTAGQGRSLCATVGDLEPYLAALDRHPKVGVCLDTCHAYAAGHDLATPDGMRRTLDALVRVAGPGRLQLVHANDSADPCGSRRDRHERIGKGRIGEAAFAELLAHPALSGVPVVIETPGDVDDHAHDVALLRQLRDR